MAMTDLEDAKSQQDETTATMHQDKKIQQLIQSKIDVVLNQLDTCRRQMIETTDQCKSMINEFTTIEQKLNELTTTHKRLDNQLNFVNRQIKLFGDYFKTIERNILDMSDTI